MGSRLSKATNTARRGLIIFLIFAISTFLFRFIFGITEEPNGLVTPTRATNSPYIVADQKLGQIPYPQKQPLSILSGSNPTYSIQDQAVLPEFPEVFNVYSINKPREKLGNAAKGAQVAANLQLEPGGRTIADNTTLWQSGDTVRSLTYDKLFEKWSYETDLNKESFDQETLSNIRLVTTAGHYDNKGTAVLSLLSLSDSYFNRANSRVAYINIDSRTGTITSATNIRTARFVYIRQSKKILASELNPNYSPAQNAVAAQNLESEVRASDYNLGVANIIARGSIENLVPDLVDFQYHQLNYGSRGVYKALNSRDAFLKLQNAEGLLYRLKPKGEDPFSAHTPLSVLEFRVEANRTTIIYIEPDEWEEAVPWTNFLQPFYLFEGTAILTDGREADFSILIPALQESEYIK